MSFENIDRWMDDGRTTDTFIYFNSILTISKFGSGELKMHEIKYFLPLKLKDIRISLEACIRKDLKWIDSIYDLSLGFPTRSQVNWTAEPQKMDRSLNLGVWEVEGLYYFSLSV